MASITDIPDCSLVRTRDAEALYSMLLSPHPSRMQILVLIWSLQSETGIYLELVSQNHLISGYNKHLNEMSAN